MNRIRRLLNLKPRDLSCEAHSAYLDAVVRVIQTGERQVIPEKYWEVQHEQDRPIGVEPGPNFPGPISDCDIQRFRDMYEV